MKNKAKLIMTPRVNMIRKEYAAQLKLADRIANDDKLACEEKKLDAWRDAIGEKVIGFHGQLAVMSVERECWEHAIKGLDDKLQVSGYGDSRQVARAKGNVLEELRCAVKKLDIQLSDIQTGLSHWENLERILEGYDENNAFEFLIRVVGFRSKV